MYTLESDGLGLSLGYAFLTMYITLSKLYTLSEIQIPDV